MTNPDGKVFFMNDENGAMQWEKPGAPAATGAPASGAARPSASAARPSPQGASSSEPPPASNAVSGGWQQGYNEQGLPYYYHVERALTQWEPPPEWLGGGGGSASALGSSGGGGGGGGSSSSSVSASSSGNPMRKQQALAVSSPRGDSGKGSSGGSGGGCSCWRFMLPALRGDKGTRRPCRRLFGNIVMLQRDRMPPLSNLHRLSHFRWRRLLLFSLGCALCCCASLIGRHRVE
jgi:hypothetical protein